MRGLAVASLVSVLLVGACGRTELEPFGAQPIKTADAATEHPRDAGLDAGPDATPDAPPDLPAERMDAGPEAPVCVPHQETCNGADDDCDGTVDEDQPAIPCPNGGNRYCVAGRYSECPRRCDVCNPSSTRTCFTSFCTFWGSQTCASDGRSWSTCAEERAVPELCKSVAEKMMKSPELEMCCLQAGHCCVDAFDLDGDGDKTEQLGNCASVTCDP